jgi:GT2 family glycosyltransferase
MSVSVIVSNFNGLRFLPRLLESLRAQRDTTLEIIVVDRNSTDGSQAYLAKQPGLRVIQHPPQTGLASGYSAGYRLTTRNNIYFSNEDMWVDEHCLSRLEAALNLDKHVVVADPWQWSYDGRQWIHGVTRFRRAAWAWNSPYPFRTADHCAPLKGSPEIPYPCAGAFMIHRKAYEEVGGWDTRFFLDHEDVDLGLRLWKAGWLCVSVPEAKVYHAVGASNEHVLDEGGQRVSEKRYASGRANIMMVQLKHVRAPLLPAVGLWWLVEMLKRLAKHDRQLLRGVVRSGGIVVTNLRGLFKDRERLGKSSPGLAPFFTDRTFNDR